MYLGYKYVDDFMFDKVLYFMKCLIIYLFYRYIFKSEKVYVVWVVILDLIGKIGIYGFEYFIFCKIIIRGGYLFIFFYNFDLI